MSQTILVIDSNPAVQAIASLALSHLGVRVETMSSAARALNTIQELKPDVVICASELTDLDPLSLSEEMKRDSSLRHIGFILLVPNDPDESTAKDYERAGVDVILAKPFKSEQLRNVVQGVFSDRDTGDDGQTLAFMLVKNSLLEKSITRYLSHRKTSCRVFSDASELAAEGSSAKITLVDASAVDTLEWFEPDTMGKLLLITSEESLSPDMKASEDIDILARPLSEDILDECVEGLIPAGRTQHSKAAISLLSREEQALLAARISASIYQRLLIQDALRHRDWESATAMIHDEMLQVLEEFEILSQTEI